MSDNIKSLAGHSGSAHHWDLRAMLEDTLATLGDDEQRGLVLIITETEDGTHTDMVNAGLGTAEALLVLELSKKKLIDRMTGGKS